MSYEQVESAWRQVLWGTGGPQSNFAYVAEETHGKIVGILIAGPEQTGDEAYQGEIYVLYVLPSDQKRGIGRALVQAAAQKLIERKLSGLLIWVLEQNPSRAFYDALGGKIVRTKEVQIGGHILQEVGYGWEDLRSLISPV